MTTVLIWFLIICAIAGLAYAAITVKNFHEKFTKEVTIPLENQNGPNVKEAIDGFDQIWFEMENTKRRADEVLVFPSLHFTVDNEKPAETLDKILNSVQFRSAAIAGTEQLVLTFFDASAFPVFLEKSASVVVPEARGLALHIWDALKDMKATAVQEWSSHSFSEIAVKCLKSYFEGVKDNWDHIMHFDLEGILILTNESKFAILTNAHAITKGLDPVFHINDVLLPHVKEEWVHHSHLMLSTLKDNAADHLFQVDPSGHFPFVTLIISSYREVGLLVDGKTDFWNSAGNILLDVAGSGTGAMAGAAAGSALFPVVGTIVGAILGGIAGRLLTNEIKFQSFKEAKENYSNLRDVFVRENKAAVQNLHHSMKIHIEMVQRDFDNGKPAFPISFTREDIYTQGAHSLRLAANEDIEQAMSRLERLEAHYLCRWGFYKQRLIEAKSQLQVYRLSIPDEASIGSEPAQSFMRLNQVSAIRNGMLESSKSSMVQALHQMNAHISTQTLLWSYQVATEYRKAMAKIKNELNNQAQSYTDFVNVHKSKLEVSERELRKEADKLGKKI